MPILKRAENTGANWRSLFYTTVKGTTSHPCPHTNICQSHNVQNIPCNRELLRVKSVEMKKYRGEKYTLAHSSQRNQREGNLQFIEGGRSSHADGKLTEEELFPIEIAVQRSYQYRSLFRNSSSHFPFNVQKRQRKLKHRSRWKSML